MGIPEQAHGLNGVPATLQRMMNQLLVGKEQFALAYLDDLVIFCRTWKEHLQHLRAVLLLLREANLTSKPAKCRLGMNETPYLGLVSHSQTISTYILPAKNSLGICLIHSCSSLPKNRGGKDLFIDKRRSK